VVTRRLAGVSELMDRPDLDPATLAHTLTDLARINRMFGATQVVLDSVTAWLATAPGPWTLLDVGTGSADIARALVDWARPRGIALTIEAIEKHPTTREFAAHACRGYPEIHIREGDALALPYAAQRFDLAFASQVLHHLDDREPAQFLQELRRVAARLLISDLRRGAVPFLSTWCALHVVSTSLLIQNDGPLSIRRGFRASELRALAEAAGWHDIRVTRQRFFRLVLTGAATADPCHRTR
jgi:2-polyprenyl-3-methyl-5-hydroxy-6-metoxy-1,4-benzoquinol methylase